MRDYICDEKDHATHAGQSYCMTHDADLVDGACPVGRAAERQEERRDGNLSAGLMIMGREP